MQPLYFKTLKNGQKVAVVPATCNDEIISWSYLTYCAEEENQEPETQGTYGPLYRQHKEITVKKYGREFEMQIHMSADEALSRTGVHKAICGRMQVKYAYY